MEWSRADREAVAHLKALLKIDTTNPPGNETAAAEYLAAVLRADGLEPVVLESGPGRGNVIARLEGGQRGEPLLLYGHLDVVPAEPGAWRYPPFTAEEAEGCIWGRGALDMKGAVVQYLMTIILLKRSGRPLAHDIIFAATADEEVDGSGIQFLVTRHPDLIRAPWGISESGGFSLPLGRGVLYPIKTAEKGAIWVTARARGKPGHGSIPHSSNAVLRLSRALARLDGRGLSYRITSHARAFLDAVGSQSGGYWRGWIPFLKNPFTAGWALDRLPEREVAEFLNAILHNTVTPTVLRAGGQTNVIPSVAEAKLDCRNLPGIPTAEVLAEIQKVLGVGIELDVEQESPPVEAPLDSPLFSVMADTLERADPAGRAAPFLASGATDAKFTAALGTHTYGFSPLRLPRDFEFFRLTHGHNERIPVDGFLWGLRVLFEAVQRFGEGSSG